MHAAATPHAAPHAAQPAASRGHRSVAAALERLASDGVRTLEGELTTLDLLSERTTRLRALRTARARGETAEAVAILSRYLPAAFETDIPGGRPNPPAPAELLCDLWQEVEDADVEAHPDLVEQTVRLGRFAPHKSDPRLVSLVATRPGPAREHVTTEGMQHGRERLRELLRQAGGEDCGSLRLPAGLGWVEEILLTLARNAKAPQSWVAAVTTQAEVASVQRAVARAADEGDLWALGRLLGSPTDIWDLDAVSRLLLTRWGQAGLEQVLEQVEDAAAAGTVPLRRLRHLLEGVADATELRGGFWAARTLPALGGEILQEQRARVLAASDDPEAAEVARQLAPHWHGRGGDLIEAAEHLLQGRAAPAACGTVTA